MAMERTRVAKVEDVTFARRGEQAKGTLHLTPHHLIFVHTPPTTTTDTSQAAPRPREVWITYPIISFCTLRPSPSSSRQPSSVRLRCRDFTFVCFYLNDERKARDVYESIKAWTCKLGRIEKLYAFTYKPQGPEKDVNPTGWAVYDPMREWKRLGVGDETKKLNWRISRINTDYAFSPTYPSLLAVPTSITDNHLNYAGRYRSRARIPVLTYLHQVNNCTITRCSQPMLGVRQNRSIQDEALLAAIFSTTRSDRPLSDLASPIPEREDSGLSSIGADLQETNTEALEDAIIAKMRGDDENSEDAFESNQKKPMIYGAQQRNMIVDARPTINAYAMQAAGMGSENMDNYKFATKAYLGIDNIHVMRDSLNKVVDALKDLDLISIGPNRELLHKSHWLKHIANVLDGVSLIARQVGLQHSHVLIHCSDGWDRTSQLSALSQLCLDPYYRTFDGFIVLIEKDWLSFGHQFRYRSGFLSSEKWFAIENERGIGRSEEQDGTPKKSGSDAMAGAQKTFENAFLSAKGFFTKQSNDSKESINVESEAEIDSDAMNSRKGPGKVGEKHDKAITKVKETAPIFHQFLDATYQLMYQHPTRFEFNERFLRRLLYHLYSCQYGTFLFDNERERREAKIDEKTTSVWNYFLARRKEFTNSNFDPVIDDNVRGKERLVFPRSQEVRWWASVFGRTDDEMNGVTRPFQTLTSTDGENETSVDDGMSAYPHSMPVSRSRTPVLTGVETSDAAVAVGSPPELRSVSVAGLASKTQEMDHKEQPATHPQSLAGPFVEVEHPMATPEPHVDDLNAHPVVVNDLSKHPELESKLGQVAVQNEAASVLADDLDPLGIGDVKDHIPAASTVKKATVERRREQLEALMQ